MAEEFKHDLPDGMTDWIAEAGGGRITCLERHIARREAWVVDVTRPDGSVAEYFLRLDREGDGSGTHSVKSEAKVQTALVETGMKVPAICAWNEDLQAALHERMPGRADLDNAEPEEQAAVLEDFIQQLVLLHSLDPDSLNLDHMPVPTTSSECALGEIEFVEQFLGGMVTDPLYTYSLQWIRNHVPERLDRVSLLQGDTGPANFMFHEGQVSAIVDWEWAHFGDPHGGLWQYLHPGVLLPFNSRRGSRSAVSPIRGVVRVSPCTSTQFATTGCSSLCGPSCPWPALPPSTTPKCPMP